MKNDGRKHMRVALSANDYDEFMAAKARAEKVAGVIMTDPQFALSLIRWAARNRND